MPPERLNSRMDSQWLSTRYPMDVRRLSHESFLSMPYGSFLGRSRASRPTKTLRAARWAHP